jgi:uncharacterized protein
MEQRLSLITLGVADLERSRRFYEEGLGWKRSNADESIVFYQLNGLILALFPRDALANDAQLDVHGTGFGGLTIAYCARSREEVDSVIEEAIRAGATLLKEANDAFWGGYSGYFADPDGFPWEVAWQPAWKIGEGGDVSLR